MKEGIVEAFRNLLTENGDWWPSCKGLSFNELGVAEAACLEAPLEDEANKVLSNLSGDKFLRPDGFTMAFWQAKWDVLKEEVMHLLAEYKILNFLQMLNLLIVKTVSFYELS